MQVFNTHHCPYLQPSGVFHPPLKLLVFLVTLWEIWQVHILFDCSASDHVALSPVSPFCCKIDLQIRSICGMNNSATTWPLTSVHVPLYTCQRTQSGCNSELILIFQSKSYLIYSRMRSALGSGSQMTSSNMHWIKHIYKHVYKIYT